MVDLAGAALLFLATTLVFAFTGLSSTLRTVFLDAFGADAVCDLTFDFFVRDFCTVADFLGGVATSGATGSAALTVAGPQVPSAASFSTDNISGVGAALSSFTPVADENRSTAAFVPSL